jgi:hypothetical protein
VERMRERWRCGRTGAVGGCGLFGGGKECSGEGLVDDGAVAR